MWIANVNVSFKISLFIHADVKLGKDDYDDADADAYENSNNLVIIVNGFISKATACRLKQFQTIIVCNMFHAGGIF